MKWLTRTEARAALGEMPESSFTLLVRAGLPSKGNGKKIRFPWPQIHRWHADHVRDRAKEAERKAREREEQEKPSKTDSLDEARRREIEAKAQLAEIDLAERRREVAPVAEFDHLYGAACERLAAQVRTLEVKLAPEVIGIQTVPEAIEKIRPFVQDLLAELHEAADVPETAEVDELDEEEVETE